MELRGLSNTNHGSDYILVIIDQLIKITILIPCHKMVREQVENTLFTNVWAHSELLNSIIFKELFITTL